MLQQPSFERRGRVLADVSLHVRRCRPCVWSCIPLVVARGLQLQSFCTATYNRSFDYWGITLATASIVCQFSITPTATILLAARGLQYVMQISTAVVSMYVCFITVRNVPVLPSLGFPMVTYVSA